MTQGNGGTPMLALRGVVAGYGGILALRNVSVDVHEGEIVTLIGSNGAGKSTTLRAITGLVHLRQGAIEYEGKRLDHMQPHKIVNLGISHVPEGRGIFFRLSVRENLELGAYARSKVDKGELDTCLLAVPATQGAYQPARRHALRRRAADARDRAGADVEAAVAAA